MVQFILCDGTYMVVMKYQLEERGNENKMFLQDHGIHYTIKQKYTTDNKYT